MNNMEIMVSTVKNNNVLTLDMGIAEGGRAVYRIYWWNGIKTSIAYYRRFKEAVATFKMIEQML